MRADGLCIHFDLKPTNIFPEWPPEDPNKPDFLVYGPDDLFETIQAALAGAHSSQHNVGVIHVSIGNAPKSRGQLATITAHVLVTVVLKGSLDLVRIVATYHDEAMRSSRGRWMVTKSFAQYLATETTTRALPPA